MENDSDYINASYIRVSDNNSFTNYNNLFTQGYKQEKAYIATQGAFMPANNHHDHVVTRLSQHCDIVVTIQTTWSVVM